MAKTNIPWTDISWNPIRGCTIVSAGCQNCYAMRSAHRMNHPGGPYEGLTRMTPTGPKWTGEIKVVGDKMNEPLGWKAPRRVFVNSMSDLFHEDVPDEVIDKVFAVMALASQHTFQVLTKRPERMRDYLRGHAAGGRHIYKAAQCIEMPGGRDKPDTRWPFDNIWLGVSVEDQRRADERIPLLLDTPAAVRFLSVEPLLGPVMLRPRPPDMRHLCIRCGEGPDAPHNHPDGYRTRGLDWVIVGGESGPQHRPMNIEWIQDIVGQCREADVPCFVKQDSGPRPGQQGRIPDDLWIKEWPKP